MTYVDGFVLVVPKKNLAVYKKMAIMGGKAWMKHGALQYVETVGNDLKPNMPTHDDMPQPKTFLNMAGAGKNDLVVFSFITFKSRKHRDEVNKKVMIQMSKDMEKMKNMKMPFDPSKMAYGGFETIVDM